MSCWTVGLLSCLGAVALVVAGLAILFIYVARRPEFKQAMSAGVEMGTCQQNMLEIYDAIERYRQKNNGEYPKDLSALIPRYLSEAGKMRCPADASGQRVSYQYFRPQKDSPETSPLLQCDHHTIMNEKIPLIILKNGQPLSGAAGRTRPQPSPGVPAPSSP
jgi:hypothetical protein